MTSENSPEIIALPLTPFKLIWPTRDSGRRTPIYGIKPTDYSWAICMWINSDSCMMIKIIPLDITINGEFTEEAMRTQSLLIIPGTAESSIQNLEEMMRIIISASLRWTQTDIGDSRDLIKKLICTILCSPSMKRFIIKWIIRNSYTANLDL